MCYNIYMKVLISLILLFGIFSVSYAAVPVLSLEKQMQRQTLVNKKNTLAEKRAAIEARKKANQEKLAILQVQNKQPKAISPPQVTSTKLLTISPSISTVQQPKTQTIVASNTTISTSRSQSHINNVDMTRVRSTWLSWYNAGRVAKWLGVYSYDNRLDSTAHDWNIVFAESRGTNYHERTKGDGYYNYPIINRWFQDRGVNPPVISGVNHSENVSYGYYNCSKSDCTDDFISAIHSSYVFFVNSSVHAKSVYQPNFTKIGFDIIVVPNERRYYVTVHYITQ